MDIDRLLALKEVRELFPADEKGNLPEGSCLLLSAMEELDFPPGRDIVTWGQAGEDGMYILMEGSAQVLDCHGEEINTLMGPGSIVGEMALIRDEPRGATVRVYCGLEGGELVLEVEDKGISFNPLDREAPDLQLPLEERPVGGLGIYMVRQFAYSVEYQYRAGRDVFWRRMDLTR